MSEGLLVIMEIKNNGPDDVLLAEKDDLKVTVAAPEVASYFPKGICMSAELQSTGLPEGVKLQTKGGFVNWINIDPKDENSDIGKYMFIGLGSYKLTIATGGDFKLPVIFDVSPKAGRMTLNLIGASPVTLNPTSK